MRLKNVPFRSESTRSLPYPYTHEHTTNTSTTTSTLPATDGGPINQNNIITREQEQSVAGSIVSASSSSSNMVRGNWQKRVEKAETRRTNAKQRKQRSEEKRLCKGWFQELLQQFDRHDDIVRRRSKLKKKKR